MTLPRPELVLIEDDDVDVMAVRRALRKLSITVPLHVHSDGVAALEWFKARPPSAPPLIVLLDLNLPRMNGLEVLRALRADPALKNLVVFVVTTSKAESDLRSAYDLNVAGYIVKSEIGRDFMQLVTLIEHYWRIVELPNA